MSNSKLLKARINKNDEFYTTYTDIEKELKNYNFSGLSIYSPCDDYRTSQFKNFFYSNFKKLGISKFTCSNYDLGTGAWKYEYDGKTENISKLSDGDFSVQSGDYDVICTNPPFSKLREFIGWVGSKKYILIFPKSAVAYNEIFPLLCDGKAWIGFTSPDSFDGQKTDMKGLTYWITNLGTPVHKPLNLNKTFSPVYKTYDTYNAIEVGKVKDIPSDYLGEIGVPITYLLGNYSGYKIKGILKGEFSKLDKYTIGHRPTLNGKSLYTRVIIQKL